MPVPTLPTPSPSAVLAQNVRAVEDRIAAAARRAGRDPAGVRLVAVTKSVALSVAVELARGGLLDLGENRADQLAARSPELRAAGFAPRWHFVGHLQRNKARAVVEHAALVHSVDSVRLVETLDRIADDVGRDLDVLAQVKLADEETKSGLDPRELPTFLARARDLRRVRVVGLMAMGPLADDADEQRARARDVFRRAADLAREHAALFARAPELSIGMSDDYEIAVEEGATLVRVGSRLYSGLDGAHA